MDVCGVDLETTGLDENDCFITEIGAMVFDGTTWEPKRVFSTFVHEPRSIPLSPFIKNLTKITDEDVAGGLIPSVAITKLNEFAKGCGAYIAHSVGFEKKFLKKAVVDLYRLPKPEEFFQGPWVCSKDDINHHGAGKKCTTLSHLAVDYGCTVDGSALHRALGDVEVMGRMLKKTGKTIDEIIAYAREPWVYLKAKVSYNDRELAKAAGYSWEQIYGTYNGPVFEKSWVKRIKESEAESERAKECAFERVVVTPEA